MCNSSGLIFILGVLWLIWCNYQIANAENGVCYKCKNPKCELRIPELLDVCNLTEGIYKLSLSYGAQKCYYYDESKFINSLGESNNLLYLWAPVYIGGGWRWLSLSEFTYQSSRAPVTKVAYKYEYPCSPPMVCVNGGHIPGDQGQCIVYDFNKNSVPRPIRIPLTSVLFENATTLPTPVGIVCNSDSSESVLPIKKLTALGLMNCPKELTSYTCPAAPCGDKFNFNLYIDGNAGDIDKNPISSYYTVIHPDDVMCCDTDVNMAGFLVNTGDTTAFCAYLINNHVDARLLVGVKYYSITEEKTAAVEKMIANVYWQMNNAPFFLSTQTCDYYVGLTYNPADPMGGINTRYKFVETAPASQYVLNSDNACKPRTHVVLGQRNLPKLDNINVPVTKVCTSTPQNTKSSAVTVVVWKLLNVTLASAMSISAVIILLLMMNVF